MTAELSAIIQNIVRVDAVGSNLNPDLVSEAIRVVTPTGQPLPPELVGKLRYPACALVVAPPTLKRTDYGNNYMVMQSKTLLSWAFPGARYAELPIDAALGILSRLASKLVPRKYQIEACKIGAEQLEGSNVWMLLLEIVWEYNEEICRKAVTEPIQPNDFGGESPFEGTITAVDLGLWRSLIPLTPDESVLDCRLDIGLGVNDEDGII